MKNIFDRIVKFNEDRGLLTNYSLYTETSFIGEEINEGVRRLDNLDEQVDMFCDLIVFSVGSIKKYNNKIDPYTYFSKAVRLLNLASTGDDFQITADTLIQLSEDSVKESYDEAQIFEIISNIAATSKDSMIKTYNIGVTRHLRGYITLNMDMDPKLARLKQLVLLSDINPQVAVEVPMAFATIILSSLINLTILDFDPKVALDEVIKVIESREGAYDEASGKWVKNKNQDPATLYKADFSKADKLLQEKA